MEENENKNEEESKKEEENVEDIRKLLEELEKSSFDNYEKKVKIIILSPFLFKNKYLTILVLFILNIICFSGVLGIFNFFQLNNKWDIVVISFCLVSFEMFFKVLLYRSIFVHFITFLTTLLVLSFYKDTFVGATDVNIFGFIIIFLVFRSLVIHEIKKIQFKVSMTKKRGKI